MTFHISVICADPAVEAMLAAALDPAAIAASYISTVRPDLPGLIGDVSWLASAADVSPRSDVAILYDDRWDMNVIESIAQIFPSTHIVFLGPRGERPMRMKAGPNTKVRWGKINWLVMPFDPEELYLRIYNMLKTPRE